ncbi:hypothetical protein EVAR_103514_1 [Eumeta japonica]|uniref:Pre-C2HC domain-containing protein n=1 Tax=Eumeta variegata TaxID=151549 RepID=A0A4C1YWQ6_EUMVA|nr:hypothetical protein EVAR_103514_1 [Eumeta japonica]
MLPLLLLSRLKDRPPPPHRWNHPPPIFLPKGANFVKISADCTRLHINYTKAVRVADDSIKIICLNIETFRSLNKYFVDNKVQFDTCTLEEERIIKVIICGIPADFALDDIKNDLCGQGFPVHSVHRMSKRDGTPLWMTLAILPRIEKAKRIFNSLNNLCGFLSIRVETPHRKGGLECPLTWESEVKPSFVNCGQYNTANYRGCPKVPKFIPKIRPNPKKLFRAPIAHPRDLENFPALTTEKTTPVVNFRPTPAPFSTPWGRNQPPRAAQESLKEAVRRAPPMPPPASATAGPSSFGGDSRPPCG